MNFFASTKWWLFVNTWNDHETCCSGQNSYNLSLGIQSAVVDDESILSVWPEVEGPWASWCWGWWGCWCGWEGCGIEEGWGMTLGRSSPCRADWLEPEAPEDGWGLSAAPTPAMAGSASKMSLARDSAKSPPPPRSSTSETKGLLKNQLVHYYWSKKTLSLAILSS